VGCHASNDSLNRDSSADAAEGLRHVEQGHARGKVVITVA